MSQVRGEDSFKKVTGSPKELMIQIKCPYVL